MAFWSINGVSKMSKYSKNVPPSIEGAIGWFYGDIKEGSTVLDVGSSTGYYGAYIKKNKQCKVYGIEISKDREEAEKVLDGVYSFDLDGEWPKEIYERQYDIIFLGDVIEHLKDTTLILKKIRKLLKPTGRAFISTPNVAHLSVRLELLGGSFEYENMGILDDTHLKYFTYETLTKFVVKAGFDIVRIDSSESDYPREATQKILEQYGLTPNEKFWELAADQKARAFQYKLVIKPRKKGVKTVPVPKPRQKPEQYKKDFIDKLQGEAIYLRDRFLDVSKKFDELHEENIKLENRMKDIVNSKSYKVAQKLHKMAALKTAHRKISSKK